MKKMFALAMFTAVSAFAVELPVCEEFEGEANRVCVVNDTLGVIVSHYGDEELQYELYANGRKSIVYVKGDAISLDSYKVHYKVAKIPAVGEFELKRYFEDINQMLHDGVDL